MNMLDWNEYHKQVLAGVSGIAHTSPDLVRGYQGLGGAAAKTALLGKKVNELIALAVTVSLRCDGCIAVHTAAAIATGAKQEEITEALGTAVAVNAGAALVYSTRVMDCYATKSVTQPEP
jgi:AhpD family alkylhydroperoxidase